MRKKTCSPSCKSEKRKSMEVRKEVYERIELSFSTHTSERAVPQVANGAFRQSNIEGDLSLCIVQSFFACVKITRKVYKSSSVDSPTHGWREEMSRKKTKVKLMN